MADNKPPPPDSQEKGAAYEAEHVHAVYEQIASHFSSTRYKPWPIISSFLLSLPRYSIGLDIGCGNGKYLPLCPHLFILASDASPSLALITSRQCTNAPHSALVASTLSLPHPRRTFDFAICIAVIHHLSTVERRREALRGILECLKQEGRALVYVWALEQGGSRRGWDEGGEQDVMVPWVLKVPRAEKGKKGGKKGKGEKKGVGAGEAVEDGEVRDGGEAEGEGGEKKEPQTDQVFQRYYHLYRKGELEADVEAAGGVVIESGYEKDNWWAIISPKLEIS